MTITPDHSALRDSQPGNALVLGGIYLDFSAGRRGVSTPECRWCGVKIHQHPQPGGVEANRGWYDGEGESENTHPAAPLGETHVHEPALEMGPVLGPFDQDFVQITYSTLRDADGELIAFLNAAGDWEIAEPYTGAGECYSDFSIYTADYTRSIN